MMKKVALVLVALVVLVMAFLRFYKLDTIPYGYHVDEASGAVTMHCYTTQGCDAEASPYPLFGFLQYGQDKPPTYIYPGIIWGKIFGTDVPSYRAYGVFVLIVGLVGFFFLARRLWGVPAALLTVLAASCSPWMWVVGRVLMESYFAPVFVIWGLYFFLRSNRWFDWAISAFLFACAMYSYPPARMQVPLMLFTLGLYEYSKRPLRLSSCSAFVVSFAATLAPMVPLYLNGQLSRRFKAISIFSPDYLHSIHKTESLPDIIGVFLHNYSLHLTPDFLFLTGDPSYVHSTRHLGIFSWFDMAAILFFVVFLVLIFVRPAWKENPVRSERNWYIFIWVNFFIGIMPAALTYEELPHSLRICGAWPFMMLLTGHMWQAVAERIRGMWLAAALAGILCSGVLAYQYFVVYPKASTGMFDFWIKDQAEALKTQEDWQQFMMAYHRRNYHIRYFLVRRLGMTCKEANTLWWGLHDQLVAKGLW